MSALKQAKSLLRKEIKKKIVQLSKEERDRQSRIITEKLLESDHYKSSDRISVFISMDDEVHTDGILKSILQSQKICFIPRYQMDNREMDMVRLYSLEDLNSLPLTKWNVKQPHNSDKRENSFDLGGLDLIIVPGLAFTQHGQRLGRGKGYYDTFLQKCIAHQSKPPVTVALAFKEQLISDLPVDEHDMKVDMVLHT